MSDLDGVDLRKLLEAGFDGVIVSDGSGKVLFANRAVTRITGSDPELLVGKSAGQLVGEGIIPFATSLEAIRNGRPCTRIQRYTNGKTAIVTSTAIPEGRMDSAGRKDTVVFTNLRDVTLLHELPTAACGDTGAGCVFASPALKGILDIIGSLAMVESTVLFEGETGVGKDVLARLLHDRSAQRSGPFVKVNCGSLPESLLESELFGYEAGAFTGARRQGKKGLVDAARGGTFFLDEIEALPIGLQPKFLELLQDKAFIRVGGIRKVEAEVRIVAASNEDLARLVARQRFRQDLYYRLSVVPIRVPALRERADDIIPLARLFLERFNAKYGMNKGFSHEIFAILLAHDWPGNIRELSNLVENLVVTGKESLIGREAVLARLQSLSTDRQHAYDPGENPLLGRMGVDGIPLRQQYQDAPGTSYRGNSVPAESVQHGPESDPGAGKPGSDLRKARQEAEMRILGESLAQGLSTRKIAHLLGTSQSTVSRKIRAYYGDDAK